MAHNDSGRKQKLAWKAVSTLAGAAGAVATRKILRSFWTAVGGGGGQEPPLNPADRRIAWTTALEWAVAAGVGTGIGRVVTQRFAAAGWESATGSPPPGIAA